MRPVLLLQLGEAPEPVRIVHGPFATWYERAYGETLSVHDGRAGSAPPDPRGYAGVIVTGSAASLTRREGWMDTAAAFVLAAAEVGAPVLGVCFGHQLIAAAFGGTVVVNPRGWEIGSITVGIETPEDPLFTGLPPLLRVNMVHQDMVAPEGLPAPLRRLGGNRHTPVAVLAAGEHVRGVQFHPEVTGPIVRGYIDARRSLLTDVDPDKLMSTAGDCPHGLAVLANFRSHFIEKS